MKLAADVIAFVENMEVVRNRNPSASLSTLPAYFQDSNVWANMDTGEKWCRNRVLSPSTAIIIITI